MNVYTSNVTPERHSLAVEILMSLLKSICPSLIDMSYTFSLG